MSRRVYRVRPSDVWDRFFWSFMVTIFVAIVWMKFLQERIRFEDGGWIAAIAIGLLWFARGVLKLRREAANRPR